MRNTAELTVSVCGALNRADAQYLVIGGVACVLHGYVRATDAIDILIARTPDNARRVLDALAGVGWGVAAEWSPDALLARPITLIGDDPRVDIFTVAWSVKYEDAVARARVVKVQDVTVPLIGLEDLIATKRTGRLQDAADLEVLEQIRRRQQERGVS